MSEVMRHSEHLTNGDDGVVLSIPDVPVTEQRKPFMNSGGSKLQHTGTARANVAPSAESHNGTTGIFLKNVHKDKHGSDTGTYDSEGRFLPQKFEDIFAKYAEGRDYLTIRDVGNVLKGQRCIADPVGWGGALFEWTATYILLWPEDGRMMKEDIRRIYDGSIFYTVAERRQKAS
ncbi:hypothetical protein G6011_07994 [Alternaria panax]|uniref:Caleosin n=1 Tax=Alternaria panax TaxID=48097 RepID=A0AAD4F9R2_9PLEO|nr:hypothetical protein G6011_07994 [Alternaria panax]